jgi:hypothetical protein
MEVKIIPINPNQLDQVQGVAAARGFYDANRIINPSGNIDGAFESAGRRAQTSNSLNARDIGGNPSSGGSGNRTGNKQNAGNVGGSGSGGSTIGGGGNPNNLGGAGGPNAACFKFGTPTEGKFVRTIVHHGIFQLLKITTENGHEVYVTGEHPFMLPDDKQMVAAELLPGDTLLTKEGPSKIKSISSGGLTYRVFTHEAEGNSDPLKDHTFWANEILVHNKTGGYI